MWEPLVARISCGDHIIALAVAGEIMASRSLHGAPPPSRSAHVLDGPWILGGLIQELSSSVVLWRDLPVRLC